jgi:hypothetical protein
MSIFIKGVTAALVATGLAASAQATTLTSNLAVDNGYVVYLSTDDAVQGVSFGSGNNWSTTFTDTTTLLAGQTYYLHIYGYDVGGIAGLLGSFSLSGTDHKFENGLTALNTGTTGWHANTTGFGGAMSTPSVVYGNNGVGPWGTRPNIASGATWIWSGDADANDTAYFSTKITAAVPEPETYALMLAGLGVLGAVARRRKTR